MEFEEMKKVWDSRNNETLYAFSQEALYKMILSKKNAARRRISKIEISLIIINAIVTIVLFIDAMIHKEAFWDYGGAIMMLLTILFLFHYRYRRKKRESTFDRSMLGELDHAIANTKSTIEVATMMIYWYLIPVGFFSIIKMLYFGASLEKWLLIIGAFFLAFFLIKWEKNAFHLPRKRRLEMLKEKLINE